MTSLDQIRADFELLDDWEDRYRYVIELGETCRHSPRPAHRGQQGPRLCQSGMAGDVCAPDRGRASPRLPGDSDAHIVRGLIAILLAMCSGSRADDILALAPIPCSAELGLNEHLTPQRSNGLASMVQRIRSDARRALGAP